MTTLSGIITPTNVVTNTSTSTVTNKTLTSPILNTALATGLKETKAAMGANNIDLSAGNYFTYTLSGLPTAKPCVT